MSPCPGGSHTVQGVADTGGNHLGFKIFVVIKYLNNISHYLHAIVTSIIQSPDKDTNISGTGQCAEQSLIY